LDQPAPLGLKDPQVQLELLARRGPQAQRVQRDNKARRAFLVLPEHKDPKATPEHKVRQACRAPLGQLDYKV